MTANRPGKTLLELTVVVGMVSSVLTLGTRTLISLMRADAAGRKAMVHEGNFVRLANRFRNDVHAAIKAEVVAAGKNVPQRLRLTQPDGQVVEYRPQPAGVQVAVLRGGKREARETYRLKSGRVRFERAGEQSQTVSLLYETGGELTSQAPGRAGRRKTSRIDAVRGRDHRFSRPNG